MRTVQCHGFGRSGKRCTQQTNFVGASLFSFWCKQHAKQAHDQVSDPATIIPLGGPCASTERVELDETGF